MCVCTLRVWCLGESKCSLSAVQNGNCYTTTATSKEPMKSKAIHCCTWQEVPTCRGSKRTELTRFARVRWPAAVRREVFCEAAHAVAGAVAAKGFAAFLGFEAFFAFLAALGFLAAF
eukprot:RCo045692